MRLIGEWNVSTVPIVPLGRHDEHKFFPAPRRGADKFARKRARREGNADDDAPGGAIQDVAGDESSGDGEGEEGEVPPEHDEEHQEQSALGAYVDNAAELMAMPLEAPSEDAPGQGPGAQAGPPPQEPAARPPPPPAENLVRVGGAATVLFPSGRITFWPAGGKFEAICRNPAHGKCVLTRTHRAKQGLTPSGFPKGGRPLGLLAAWLLKADHTDSKEAHWSTDVLGSSFAEREAGRRFVETAPGGDMLLGLERPRAEGEPAEPETLDGLV